MADLPRWEFEAHIGFMPTYGNYLFAYRQAVDLLFQQINSGKSPVDTVSLPFLFMVRHSLEIGYKMNINYLAQYSDLDEKVNWDKHFLAELHEAFGKHFEAIVEELEVEQEVVTEFWEMHQKVGGLTKTLKFSGRLKRKLFSSLDPACYSFEG